MGYILVAIIAIIAGVFFMKTQMVPKPEPFMANSTIFDFSVESSSGQPVSLSEYKGKKAYLLINVASECGLTQRNYAEMAEVYEKFSSKGLEILAFPCNNFGGQEPGTNEAISLFAEQKGATYPVFGKLECNNKDPNVTHPLYRYLMSSIDGGMLGDGLKWNFAKFLVDADGKPVQRFLPITSPVAIEKDIAALLE